MLYTQLDIPEQIKQAVAQMGFTELTEIQEKAMPIMLSGRDIIAKAPTGTGKTCAFGIPLIMSINPELIAVQGVVLAPTRELAVQISEDLKELCSFYPTLKVLTLYGGQNIQIQIDKLKRGAHIIVATPGRLQDHINRRTLNLSKVDTIVLDEADEMLNMGFYKEVVKILDTIKSKKHLAMFSATISREVMDIGWLYQNDPEEITVAPMLDSAPKIAQYKVLTTNRNKLADLTHIIIKKDYQRCMVFCNTKYTTAMVTNQLVELNFIADCLHGDLSQKERNEIMGNFKNGKISVLVATDVAARGIDVSDVDAVFNYDIPLNNESYTHRIGRTGRAKREGAAYMLFTEDETLRVRDILRYTKNLANEIDIYEQEW